MPVVALPSVAAADSDEVSSETPVRRRTRGLATDRRRVEEAAAETSRWKEGSSAGAEEERERRGEKAEEEGGDQPLGSADERGLGTGQRGGAGRADRSGVGGGNKGVGMEPERQQQRVARAETETKTSPAVDQTGKKTTKLTNYSTAGVSNSSRDDALATTNGGDGVEEQRTSTARDRSGHSESGPSNQTRDAMDNRKAVRISRQLLPQSIKRVLTGSRGGPCCAARRQRLKDQRDMGGWRVQRGNSRTVGSKQGY